MQIVERLLVSTRKKIIRTEGLAEAMEIMKETDERDLVKDFADDLAAEDLKSVIQSRFPVSRAAASFWTPEAIKALRPPTACTLRWQISHEAFEAYMPIPEHLRKKGPRAKKTEARSRSYGGGKWTQHQALAAMVSFLWNEFKKHGGETCPSKIFLHAFAILLGVGRKQVTAIVRNSLDQ